MASVTGSVIQVDEAQVRAHVDEVVRSSVEATLSGRVLRAEAHHEGRRGDLKSAAAAELAL